MVSDFSSGFELTSDFSDHWQSSVICEHKKEVNAVSEIIRLILKIVKTTLVMFNIDEEALRWINELELKYAE